MKLDPSNSCPVSALTHGPLCGPGCRFLRCYGYRRVFIHDHLGTLGAPSGVWSGPAVTPQAQDLTVGL